MMNNKKSTEASILFEIYGITEWKEKSVILSDSEKNQIMSDLIKGEISPITKLVMLPFHQFIKEYYLNYYIGNMQYYKRINFLDNIFSKDSFENNPSIGYILYLLPTNHLMAINKYIKYPQIEPTHSFKKFSVYNFFADLCQLLTTKLEDYGKETLFANRDSARKYIHIMSYVDSKEAEKLGLTGYTFYSNGKYRGFDLKEKLDSLNPIARNIVLDYFGFNGEYISISDLSKIYKNNRHLISTLLDDDFVNNFAKSLGEFRNTIGYIERPYRDKEHRDYQYKNKYTKIFRLLDLGNFKNQLQEIYAENDKKFTK